MTDHSDLQWNNDEIAKHLKSAVDTLTPDVLDKIDLTTPQDIYTGPSKVTRIYRRMRTAATVLAACLCVAVLGGGVARYQNSRVDSVVGIDVNPSIELSVNRNDKVLKAEALNSDAEEILDDMDLKNVDVDIAVNALIGSMVRHGYLNDLDNAILVTVANDDKKKASELRQDVVVDIEASLEEHKVQAVVYDQQAPVSDEVRELAREYGISYGKAYFLQELIDENDLGEEDMKEFAGMTMEEIAKEITERSYTVRRDDDEDTGEQTSEKSSAEHTSTAATRAETEASTQESLTGESSSSETNAESQPPSTEPYTTAPAGTTAAEETEESSSGKKAKIDYVDFEDGRLNVVFKGKVKWKNPTVSVKDENGGSYSAMITDTSPDSCEIAIKGLEGGADYVFVLAGVAPRDGGSYASIKGYFDTPDIADEVTEGEDEEETEETDAAEPTQPQESASVPSDTVPAPETLPATEPETQSAAEGGQTVAPVQDESGTGQ